MGVAEAKYDITARFLHWLSALVILWATISGFIITTFNIDEVSKQFIANFNVSVTTIFIPVFLLRILYRCIRGTPDHTFALTQKEIQIAKMMHGLMYILVCVVLVSGVLMMKKDASLFGLLTLPHLLSDTRAINFFRHVHTCSTMGLAAL